ncbi:MAG: FxsA family protein [Pseudomonadota bacterium]
MPQTRVRIFPILMILFLVVPIIEIYLLIEVGGMIGVLPTIALVVLTAVIGASLLKSQGSETYLRFNQALSEGRMPANEILEGVALLIGGALLLTPGFFTDAIGFICLLPFTRRPVVKLIINKFNPLANIGGGAFTASNMGGVHSESAHRPRSGDVIEGEVADRPEDR